MQKPKILIWSDFVVDTGFGVVAKNLFSELHKEYDVSVLAINYAGDKRYDTSKYFVYSVTRMDMLGLTRINKVIDDVKPDIMILFQDIFHISELLPKIQKQIEKYKTKLMVYFPIDGAPFSIGWKNVLEEADTVFIYSDWARTVIQDALPGLTKNMIKLYHGVDQDTFFPHNTVTINAIRKKYNWDNKFVACNVNRFQPRKAIPLTLRAWSIFAKGYKECKCGNIMPLSKKRCDLNMCPPEDIIKTVDSPKKDVTLYLHMLAQEMSMGQGRANLLQNHALNAGFTDPDLKGGCLALNGKDIYGPDSPQSEVNNIYNAANVNISSTQGEGCGLSLIEAAAAGTPSIAPKNSAIPEMLRNTGHQILNVTVTNQAMDNGHLRPIVDVWKMAEALEIEYKRWKGIKKDKEIRQECIDNVREHFQWDDKKKLLHSEIAKLLN